MSKTTIKDKVTNLEAQAPAKVEEDSAFRGLPMWLAEFYLGIDQCLERPKAWRNPAPSLEHLDKARELLSLLGAGHLSSLFDSQNVDGWDKWMMKLVIMILEKMAVSHISRETGLSRDQTAIDLDLMLKIRGFGFVQPDLQAWARLSPEAKSYLTRLKPMTPRKGER